MGHLRSRRNRLKTFIQITEVWVPNRNRDALEFHSGLYGPHQSFRLASERMHFGIDEGLPGKAWASRHPIVLKDLQHSYFLRSRQAQEAGLSCAIALPVFAGEHLLAVLVMFCAQDDESAGAVEVWHNAEDKGLELTLEDGYYGILDGFEFAARHTRFPRASGLPGIVWDSNLPLIVSDLGHNKRFLRRDDARTAGLCTGLGLPSPYLPGHTYVVSFLSALGTPIARRFEIWVPSQEHGGLRLHSAHCDNDRQLPERLGDITIERGLGALGRAWFTGIPTITEHLDEDRSPNARAAADFGLTSMVSIPILNDGTTSAVVGLYL